jgi:hypothetical protein
MSSTFDLSDFTPTSIQSWITFINFIPRYPYLYIADAITSCFLVRPATRIKVPVASFVLGLTIATFADNCDSILNNRKFAVFDHKWLFPVFAAVWLGFNYCPFDLVFKISKISIVSLSGAFVNGFLAGRDVTRGVDLAVTHYPTSWVPVILIGTAVGAGKHILLYIYSAIYSGTARSGGPILSGVLSAALGYYWFTDLGHISNTLWFDKEETRLAVIVILSLFGFVHSAVKDSAFAAFHDVLADIVGFIMPYYGQTWTPPSLRTINQQSTRQTKTGGEKLKTD